MKLKTISILGFKSFRDKTSLSFSPGISAIVGPNGCGKSNVVDAIRWVMGEQRISLLRGKKMEDVIFNGSEDALPVSMAEVAITLENDDKIIQNKYSDCTEVTVARKIFRDGESEYTINNVPCRLLDVREFFMDAGVGSRTYSIVEQEKVSRLIEAKPDERRQFIEEAAGIIKYKSRKESATRKMEATRQNMLRLNDIAGEVKTQLNATSRQAKKAERFKTLKQEVREAQISLSLQLFGDLIRKREALEKDNQTLDSRRIEAETSAHTLEASIEELKAALAENETATAAFQERFYALKNEISIKEQRIDFSKKTIADLQNKETNDVAEIAELKRRREAIESEIGTLERTLADSEGDIAEAREAIAVQQGIVDELKERELETREELDTLKAGHIEVITESGRLKNLLSSIEKEIENLTRKAARETEEIDDHNKKVALLKQTLAAQKADLASSERRIAELKGREATYREELALLGEQIDIVGGTVEDLKEQIGMKASRLASLRQLQESFEWCTEGTRCILKESRQSSWTAGQIHGLVADYMEVPKEYETAVEAALGEKLQYIVVDNQDDGIRAIDFLKQRSSGRGSFVPLRTDCAPSKQALPHYLEETVKLTDVVGVRGTDMNGFVDMLLGDVLLIPDLPTGKNLWKRNGFTGTFVTPEGDIISHEGILTGGSTGGNGHSLLRNKREIAELDREIEGLTRNLGEERNRKEEIAFSIEERKGELENIRKGIHEADLSINGARKDVERTEGEISWIEQRIRVLNFNKENVEREERDSKGRIDELKQSLAANEATLTRDNDAIAHMQEQWRVITGELEEQESRLIDRKIALTTREERTASSVRSLQNLRTTLREMEDRITSNSRDISEFKTKIQNLTEEIMTTEEGLHTLYDTYENVEKELGETRERHNALETLRRAREGEYQTAKKVCDGILKDIGRLALEIKEATMQAEALSEGVDDKYQVQLAALLPEFTPLDEEQRHTLEERLKEGKRRLEDFGEVNLLALSEHEELKERHEFLTTQLNDLATSLETLQKTISRINQITRKRFSDTFEAVNDNFKKVFPRLFPGGRGSLQLTDETDMLETGVDIEIQIPGKKRQNLSLLSGGEKALAAVSLIFAILMHRPTPFLILDEADAPLDDTNVTLFTRLIEEIARESQIIYITHNKRTMEAADNLVGVTMQKSGISSIVSVNMN